jgi:2-keto-4-pentenoate hydratase
MTDWNAGAAVLRAARQERRTLGPLGPLAPASEAEAYALQRALAKTLGATPPAGFKVGATNPAMQAYLGVSSPAAGFMSAATLKPTGFTSPWAEWVAPGVECEIAVRLSADLPFTGHTPTRAQAAAAIGAVMPAIEIVENRYVDMTAVGAPTLIADQFFHAAAALGPETRIDPGALEAGALRDLAGRMMIDGTLFGEGRGEALLGDPLEVVRWLAASPAAAAFGGLREGQIILCGSVTLPAWLAGPALVEIAFGGLASVTVRFT